MRFQRATSHESEMFSSRFREAGRSVQRKLGRQSEEPVPYSEEMGGGGCSEELGVPLIL